MLPGEETTWWHRLSNVTWTSINVTVVVVIVVALVVGLEAIKRDDALADSPPTIACATPPPDVTLAVLARLGTPESSRPAVQVEAPTSAVLVRIGPPDVRYAVVRPVAGTYDIQFIEPATAGLYADAMVAVNRCG